ncbi:metallopeptidase family protein [Actinospica sp.]|jgi:predicted Zn-dependent protease with MMP-like domain|uniref:metallopeptidase family protein n=1 Tax=Actinospica sp. TaxID=1872142 RepID=UPI002C109EB4|nr:metallopeptidase family protein [Actinospica sp.]HWG25815.1 metallopeptidase family protein [Actinospica sp.]
MLDIPAEEFEQLVEDALETIPHEFARAIDNLAFFVEDESPVNGPELFGLYEGVPLTQRGHWYAGVQPDRITIYRLPILRACWSRWEAVDQVAKTVVHEVGHYFGISDQRLHELGY